MPVYTCAVADCTSVSRKKNQGVEGWKVFPRKKDAARRRLWERRCKRGPKWRATKDHAICSKHFIDWCQGPSPSHPDPELFGYNNWKASGSSKSWGQSIKNCDSPPGTENKENSDTNVLNIDFWNTEQEVQADVQVEVGSTYPESASLTAARDETPQFPAPSRDHTYSSTSITSTHVAEPLDAAVQVDLNISTDHLWSRSVRVSLCEIIERHRSLWDQQHPDYLKHKLQHKVFADVARELEVRHPEIGSLTRDQVCSEFKKHKSYFLREYKKLQAADSGAKPSKWEYYDNLTFLSEHAETLARENWSAASESQATAAADSPPPGSPWLSSMEQGADSRDSIAWSSETTLSLLDKVQEEEAIWDTRHPSYYKKNLKRAVYEELCSKMKEEHASLNKLTADDVVARFEYLRRHFQKHLREIEEAPLGSAGRCITRWEYFEACSFLLPVYCNGLGVSNFQLPSDLTGDQVVCVDLLEDPLDTGEAPEGVNSPPSPSSTISAPSPPPPTSEAPAVPGDMSKPAVSPSPVPQCPKKQDTPQGRQGSCVPTLARPATHLPTISLKRQRETDNKDLVQKSILKTLKRVHSLAQALESRKEPAKLDLASQTVLSIMQYIPDSHQDLKSKFTSKVMTLAAETVAEYNGRVSEARKES